MLIALDHKHVPDPFVPGIGSQCADEVLLLAVAMEPPKRLGAEAQAKARLDTVVAVYAQRSGVSLSFGAAGRGDAGASGGALINATDEFIKFQVEQEQFARRQIKVYMRYLKQDFRSGDQLAASRDVVVIRGSWQSLHTRASCPVSRWPNPSGKNPHGYYR